MPPLYIAKAEADRNSLEFQAALKQATDKGVDLVHVSDDKITLTRAQARNRAAYEKAETAARGIGQQVRILADVQTDTPAPGPLATRTHVKTEDAIFVTRDDMHNRATFLRLEAEAKREHKVLRPIRSWDDLPDAERAAIEAQLNA